MFEIWKDIKDYEGKYQVSNLGRVKSLDRIINFSDGRVRKFSGKLLKPALAGNGYFFVTLASNQNNKRCYVHRLVAEAFIPNSKNLPQVNHLDENKTNNTASNLEWCTAKENINYGSHNERVAKTNSKPVWQLSMSGERIKLWKSTWEPMSCGYEQAAVQRCCAGKYKQAYGFLWRYA